MNNLFEKISTYNPFQLTFLQKIVENVEKRLSTQSLNTTELQSLITDITANEICQNDQLIELKEVRDTLISFLQEKGDVVHYLIISLHEYQSRYFAASFLGWFGNSAKVALPELIDLASGHGIASGAARKSILLIGDAESEMLNAIMESVRFEDDESFRNLTTLATKTKLATSNTFFEMLKSCSKHSNPYFRELVADVIWSLGSLDQEEIISILKILSSDKEEFVRDAALEALNMISSGRNKYSG